MLLKKNKRNFYLKIIFKQNLIVAFKMLFTKFYNYFFFKFLLIFFYFFMIARLLFLLQLSQFTKLCFALNI